MLNWKKPASGFGRSEQGNFPEVVHSVIKDRCLTRAQITKPVTIAELNTWLDDLARANGVSDKTKLLTAIHQRMTAQEQRWMLRIVIKDMQIGMKETSIFKELHPDAQELYNSVCDLQATCQQCSDPSFRLSSITLQLFKPVKPRLAARVTWHEVPKLLGKKGRFVAEYKLDGERVLLHFERAPTGSDKADRVQWWTRNCHDCTGNYGEAMAPVLAKCFGPAVKSLVLDGEMMVWNRLTGEYSPFGENRSLSDSKKRMDQDMQPCYVVFDALYVNGENICHLVLRERRERIEGLLVWESHSMELCEQTVVVGETQQDMKEDVMRWLDRAMTLGYEGVVFKALESTYVPGERTNEWAKLKPDHIHDMGDQLDLLIIGAYYGEGKRRLPPPPPCPAPMSPNLPPATQPPTPTNLIPHSCTPFHPIQPQHPPMCSTLPPTPPAPPAPPAPLALPHAPCPCLLCVPPMHRPRPLLIALSNSSVATASRIFCLAWWLPITSDTPTRMQSTRSTTRSAR